MASPGLKGHVKQGTSPRPGPFPIPVPAMTLDFKQKTAVGGIVGARYEFGEHLQMKATVKMLDRVSVGIEAAYGFP